MLLIVIRNFLHRRMRSLLTVLGIVIGTTLILSLLFLGEGMQNAIAAELQNFGSDLIYIMPGSEDNPFGGIATGQILRDKDIKAIEDVDGVRLVWAFQSGITSASLYGEEKSIMIGGNDWYETQVIFEESQGYGLAEGTWPDNDSALEVVVGAELAKNRFNEEMVLGDTLVIKGREYEVVGIFAVMGDPVGDNMAYFSTERFRMITDDPAAGFMQAAAKISAGYDINEIAYDIEDALWEQPGVVDFLVLTPEKTADLVGDVLGIIQLVLGGIAAIALIVGGVGIMNTMFTSVLERTREIGVLKALGATSRKIMYIFLIEAGVLGIVGGAIGLLFATLIAEGSELAARSQGFTLLQVNVEIPIVIYVLLFTTAIGLVSGAFPAFQASRMKPTDALRYE